MRAGTTGQRTNDAPRGTGRAGRLVLRAGPPMVTARAVRELPPPGKVAHRQTAAPAGPGRRASPVPPAPVTAAQTRPGRVRLARAHSGNARLERARPGHAPPGHSLQVRARSGRVPLRHVRPGRVPRARARPGRRPGSVLPEHVPPGHPFPGGATATIPGAIQPGSAGRGPVPTARPCVRPAVRMASPGGHLATGPGHPRATVAESAAPVRLARGPATGRGAATVPDMATGIGAATGAGVPAGNDQEADVRGPRGTMPRPGPGTSPDRRFPTRSAPSNSTPRPAPS